MSSISYRKVKSVAKDVQVRGPLLWDTILKTMSIVSKIVGGTLGPGGCPVLIERQEVGLPNMVTKDGVTVYRALGFPDATMHAIMETARDASVRTAEDAGDGTTTATVLSEAIVRYMGEYIAEHPKMSPQKVVRILEKFFREDINSAVKTWASKIQLSPEVQRAVIMCSTNGDAELTNAVLKCFEITGDAGNVTILEEGGPSGYRVEPLKGYSLGMGYEESCRAFAAQYLNDQNNSLISLKKPCFILYFGQITELNILAPLMEDISRYANNPQVPTNFVLMATGFSDTVLAQLGGNFKQNGTVKVLPLLIPKSPVHNGELHTLQDVQALTGGHIFDPLTRPLESARFEDIGSPLDGFEAMRYRSNIVGRADEGLVMIRIEELELALQTPASKYETSMLKERIAKLSGGIAKLIVVGASSGEIREKRDRAEDAVCALRGALKHGVLPGGAWTFVKLATELRKHAFGSPLEILARALEEPFLRLMENAGFNAEERAERLDSYRRVIDTEPENAVVWNGITDDFVDPKVAGIMDSQPAVLEALRNSLSIASLLGTLGGAVVFQRDPDVERTEASDAYAWMKNAGV